VSQSSGTSALKVDREPPQSFIRVISVKRAGLLRSERVSIVTGPFMCRSIVIGALPFILYCDWWFRVGL
jgi:hypothetical protein